MNLEIKICLFLEIVRMLNGAPVILDHIEVPSGAIWRVVHCLFIELAWNVILKTPSQTVIIKGFILRSDYNGSF